MFAKSYSYVGDEDISAIMAPDAVSGAIKCQNDVQHWITATGQTIGYDNEVTATFVIKKNKYLYLSDRHSEHVACANGDEVLSAGEITFKIEKTIEVSAVTNQSTDYCPEPKSWKYVVKALKKANLDQVKNFTSEFIFRRCQKCSCINIVKDDWYVCAVCDTDLDSSWNIN